MTAPLAQQTVSVKDSAGVRKRRRRATAGGAADDCFTCSKRNVKCDRRRPYCSQCLEIGNECSGYKTQLTWGVGVASRGKLRGLSLPVAKAPPVSKEPKKSPPARTRANTTTSSIPNMSPWPDHDGMMRRTHQTPIDIPAVSQSGSTPVTPYGVAAYDYLSVSHPEQPTHMSHSSWGSMQYSPPPMVHSPDPDPKYKQFPLPLVTENLPSSMDSVGSDIDYLSPMSQSYTREDMPFVHSPNMLYDGYAPAPNTNNTHQTSPVPPSPPMVVDHSQAPTSCPGLVYAPSEASSSLHSHMDPFESHLGHKMMRDCDKLGEHHHVAIPTYQF